MFKNIIANYLSKIWGIISVFLFVPIYVNLLGIESYAIINFYNVILTIMYFADGGLSATLNRELARTTDKQSMGDMLKTIERIYLVICVVISIVICLFSRVIASKWLNAETISVGDLSIYISLMGVSLSFQLFTTLESSGLMGLEKQVLSNSIQVLSGIFRSAVVLVPLYFSPSLLVFFAWQLFVNCTFFFVTRYNLWKFIGIKGTYKFDVGILKTVGRFAGGMMLMAIIASLNTQIDKLLISKMLSLKEFGLYSLAGIVSQVPVIVITPIALAVLPRLVKATTEEKKDGLSKLFHHNSFFIAVLSTSAALVLFLYTKDFLLIWTKDTIIAEKINYVTKILIVGSVFLSFQYMPYHLAIANGHTKTNVTSGLVMIVLIVPSMYFCIKSYGLIGASFPWLVLNLIATFYLGYFLIKKFLNREFASWLGKDTLIPLGISLILGVLIYFTIGGLEKKLNVLVLASLVGFTNILVNSIVYIKLYLKVSVKQFIRVYVRK